MGSEPLGRKTRIGIENSPLSVQVAAGDRMHNHTHSFRADIAGLRALAVLPIVLFHAGLSQLAGGFVGVDVFFVISGFLITGIIIRDVNQDSFSVLEFYRRRVARIFPALILVLAFTLAAGALWMLPNEMRDLGASSAAASLFTSNFYFLLTTDYFGGAAEAKPLLHTWSLAVEEQFYLFYPVMILLILKRLRAWLSLIIFAVCLASFSLAVVVGQFRPELSFYMLPTRAWELGVGALIALNSFPKVAPRLRQGLAVLGLAMITLAIVVVRPNEFFPGPNALLPVLGTALLIAYGRDGFTATLLSARPMVWIGDISYSLYLWHWPIITLYRLHTGVELDLIETTGLTLVSIAAAALTRVAIEEPLRTRLTRLARIPVVIGGFSALVIVAGASAENFMRPTVLKPISPNIQRLAAVADYRDTPDYTRQFRKGVCFIGSDTSQTFDRHCLATDPARADWVVFGDSHAAQYWRAFADHWPERNVIQATASGCRPLLETVGVERCTAMVDYVLSDVLRPSLVDGVIFAGRWKQDELPALIKTALEVKRRGLAVVVIGPTVEYDGDLPLILARASLAGTQESVRYRLIKERNSLDRVMAKAFEEVGITYLSQQAAECPKGHCQTLDETGLPLHFDYGHLTLTGSRIMVSRFDEVLRRVG